MKFITNYISIRDDDAQEYTQNPGHSGRGLNNKVFHRIHCGKQCFPQCTGFSTATLWETMFPTVHSKLQHLYITPPSLWSPGGRYRRFQMAPRHDDLHGNGPPLHYRFFCLANICTTYKLKCTAVPVLFIYIPFFGFVFPLFLYSPFIFQLFLDFVAKISTFSSPSFSFSPTAPPRLSRSS